MVNVAWDVRVGTRRAEGSRNPNNQSFTRSKLTQIHLIGRGILDQNIKVGDFISDFNTGAGCSGEGAESLGRRAEGGEAAESGSCSHFVDDRGEVVD